MLSNFKHVQHWRLLGLFVSGLLVAGCAAPRISYDSELESLCAARPPVTALSTVVLPAREMEAYGPKVRTSDGKTMVAGRYELQRSNVVLREMPALDLTLTRTETTVVDSMPQRVLGTGLNYCRRGGEPRGLDQTSRCCPSDLTKSITFQIFKSQ
jgi:hypothetical protein